MAHQTKQANLYEVIGKTKSRGETYHATNCDVCGAPLSIMVELGEIYVERPRFCSDRCADLAISPVNFTEPISEQDAQAAELAVQAGWLGGMEPMQDPRTPEQIALDEWQTETTETRESDRPL